MATGDGAGETVDPGVKVMVMTQIVAWVMWVEKNG